MTLVFGRHAIFWNFREFYPTPGKLGNQSEPFLFWETVEIPVSVSVLVSLVFVLSISFWVQSISDLELLFWHVTCSRLRLLLAVVPHFAAAHWTGCHPHFLPAIFSACDDWHFERKLHFLYKTGKVSRNSECNLLPVADNMHAVAGWLLASIALMKTHLADFLITDRTL